MQSPPDDDSPASAPAPRQVAVALEGRTSALPRIVASGYGEVAKQILEIAFANGIRVREDADLAQILAALDIGEDVPLEALQTISSLLARVYAANGDMPPDAHLSTSSSPPPSPSSSPLPTDKTKEEPC